MMQTDTTREHDARSVATWRREQLVGSGFPSRLAGRVAGDPRYDLHALIELAEHGCRPDLAVRILAPLEQNSAA